MSQRTDKVESLVKQIAAAELAQLPKMARVTVTKVDISPDLREATVWLGIVAANEGHAEVLLQQAVSHRHRLQEAVAARLTTKFVPRLTLKRDQGGEYAEEITRLIRGL